MLITYQYKIKPSTKQIATIEKWLELCRLVWNRALAERLDWLRRTRCQIDRCSLISEPIGEIPVQVDYYTQQNYLPELKKLTPEYKELYAECLQDVLRRLDKAWKRWLVPDAKGKKGGRPKFKSCGDYKSFTYPRVNCPKAGVTLTKSSQLSSSHGERTMTGNIIKLSKIGEMPVVVHRQIPDGTTSKTCTVVRKADGFYASISALDDTVPDILPVDKVKSATAIDMGLISFLTTAQGVQIPVRKHFRQIEQ
ncbi:MAG: RNA-guided endonuclease InsQ/TnpB family protein, partial [Xenococcaceae cyanobacterium]